jgi:hypothetical protein
VPAGHLHCEQHVSKTTGTLVHPCPLLNSMRGGTYIDLPILLDDIRGTTVSKQ